MSFQQKIADGIQQKYGHTLSNSFQQYCKSEKISDEALYYDLTQVTYKWSIMEVFLIDILLLKNKDGKRIYKYMQKLASEQPEPEPEPEPEPKHKKSVPTKEEKTTQSKSIPEQSKNKSIPEPQPQPEHKESASTKALKTEQPNESNESIETESIVKTEINDVNKSEVEIKDNNKSYDDESKMSKESTHNIEIESKMSKESTHNIAMESKMGKESTHNTEIESKMSKESTDSIENESQMSKESTDNIEIESKMSKESTDNIENESKMGKESTHNIENESKANMAEMESIETIENVSNEDKINETGTKAAWVNLIFNVSLHSVFDNWKTYDYSPTDDITVQSIQQRLKIEKDGRGKFKMIRVGTFAYFKKDNPKGYHIAVRCGKHHVDEAYVILDQLTEKLDAKLETVQKIEKFKYKPFLDEIVNDVS